MTMRNAPTMVMLALCFLASTPAAAQTPSSDSRAVAETLFFTGRGLMEAGRYPEACRKLEESYRLDPAAGTLLNLALCHEKEGRIASSWGEYRQSLVDARRSGRSEREEVCKERIAELEPLLPKLIIDVPPASVAPGMQVLRNDVATMQAAWGLPLPVDPGDVRIEVSAPGRKTWTASAHVAEKETAKVTIPPLEIEEAPRTASSEPEPAWTTRKTVGVVVAASGVVALGVGAIFGVRALGERSDSDAACPAYDGELRCSQEGADSMKRADTSAWVSNIAIGAGIAAVGTGTILYFTGRGHPPTRGHLTAPRIAVTGAPGGGAQAFIGGAF